MDRRQRLPAGPDDERIARPDPDRGGRLADAATAGSATRPGATGQVDATSHRRGRAERVLGPIAAALVATVVLAVAAVLADGAARRTAGSRLGHRRRRPLWLRTRARARPQARSPSATPLPPLLRNGDLPSVTSVLVRSDGRLPRRRPVHRHARAVGYRSPLGSHDGRRPAGRRVAVHLRRLDRDALGWSGRSSSRPPGRSMPTARPSRLARSGP